MRAPRVDKERFEAGATDFVVRLAFLGLFAWWSLELVRPFAPIVIWAGESHLKNRAFLSD